MAQRRYQLRRVAGKTVVACTQQLAAFAEKLGHVADDLAAADPLPPPLRVFQELYEVPQPQQPHGCQPFSNERLLNLAAAMSQTAAVSSRQELYPKGMAAERALRLGMGVLSGLGLGDGEGGFSIEQIRDRLRGRYPEAEPLPDRPELDDLLNRTGLDVRWNPETTTYHRREQQRLVTSGSSVPKRRSTATSTRHVEVTPDVAEARQFEERLQHAYHDGGFLVLTVRPSRMRFCEANILKRFNENGRTIERVSFDDMLFAALRDEAEDLAVDWSIIEDADGAEHASQDWSNLLHLTGLAAATIAAELMNRQNHLLLVHPGLVARYELMSILETLRDKVGHDMPCPGVWVLVAADGQSDMPILDHAVIPLITSARGRKSPKVGSTTSIGGGPSSRSLPKWRVRKGAAEHGSHQDAATRTQETGRRIGGGPPRSFDAECRD